jgi:hypothetical protein
MSSEQMKPFRAWMAWHPTEGALTITARRSKTAATDALLEAVFRFKHNYYAKAEAYDAARDVALRRAAKDGWRIEEVEIRSVKDEQ